MQESDGGNQYGACGWNRGSDRASLRRNIPRTVPMRPLLAAALITTGFAGYRRRDVI